MKVVKIMYDKFISSYVKMEEINGEWMEVLCIPMPINGLRKSKGGHIVGSFSINKRKKVGLYNDNYYVSLYTNKSVWNNVKKLGREADLKFIGNVLETKDPRNIFAKIINMDADEVKEIKALDTMYSKLVKDEKDEKD